MFPALPLVFFLTQAQPAPAPPPLPPPPLPMEAPPPAVNSVGFAAGFGLRLARAADDVPPPLGVALTTLVGHRYALVGPGISLGVSASFAFERYSRTVRITRTLMPGQPVMLDGVRSITLFDFVALQTAGITLGRVRPWLALGGGLSLGHFRSPEDQYLPGESRETLAVLQAGAGAEVEIAPVTDVGLRLEYVHPLPQPTFTTAGGRALKVFGSRLTLRLALLYRF